MHNPRVFFDVTIAGNPAGRIVMELFADTTPRTADNFRALCTGEMGRSRCGLRLHYKDSVFHRVVPGLFCQGGDFAIGDNRGGQWIYDPKLPDENFIKKHTGPGVLGMIHTDGNTNGSHFYICTVATPWLDGKHVVFGQVVEGMDVLKRIERFGSSSGQTSRPVVIADSGELLP